MIYRINFHALHAPLRFRFAFSRGLFFSPSFSFTKNILVPPPGIRASGNTGSAPSWADTGLSSNSTNVDRPRPQCPPT